MPKRADRAFATGPEQLPFGRVFRDPDLEGVVRLQDLLDRRGQLAGTLGQAVDLDQQHRPGARRIAGLVVRLDRADGDLVHHLQRGRDDAVADHVRDGLAGGFDAREGRHQGADRLRGGEELDEQLRGHGQGSLRADQEAEQVETGPVGILAAHPVHGAVGEHHLHPQDVVGGHAVIEAVRST